MECWQKRWLHLQMKPKVFCQSIVNSDLDSDTKHVLYFLYIQALWWRTPTVRWPLTPFPCDKVMLKRDKKEFMLLRPKMMFELCVDLHVHKMFFPFLWTFLCFPLVLSHFSVYIHECIIYTQRHYVHLLGRSTTLKFQSQLFVPSLASFFRFPLGLLFR